TLFPYTSLFRSILGVAFFRVLPTLVGARLCGRVRARLLLQLSQPPLQRGNLHIAGIRTTRSGLLLRDLLSRRATASIPSSFLGSGGVLRHQSSPSPASASLRRCCANSRRNAFRLAYSRLSHIAAYCWDVGCNW